MKHCNWKRSTDYMVFRFISIITKVVGLFLSLVMYIWYNLMWWKFISDLQGPSWSWSYGSWIYNYLCNQCLSPLKLWGTLVSSTNKTDRRDITEILLKVALNTTTLILSDLQRAHYKSANLGINGPYKSAKKVHYKSVKNLPVFLMSNYYKNNKNIIWICCYLFPMYFERHFYTWV